MMKHFNKHFIQKIGTCISVSHVLKQFGIKRCEDTIKLRKWFINNLNFNPEFQIIESDLVLMDYERKKVISAHCTGSFDIESLKHNIDNKTGTYCYVLKLEEDNYYVGLTSNLKRRIKEHFDNNGSKWTKIHKPIEIHSLHEISSIYIAPEYYDILPYFDIYSLRGCHESFEISDLYVESYITYDMITKYGFNKVRGSSLIKPFVDYTPIYSRNIHMFMKIKSGSISEDELQENIMMHSMNKVLTGITRIKMKNRTISISKDDREKIS